MNPSAATLTRLYQIMGIPISSFEIMGIPIDLDSSATYSSVDFRRQ
jgi:hypothetical protein